MLGMSALMFKETDRVKLSSREFADLPRRQIFQHARVGWGKGNIFGGAFRKAKYEIRRRRNPRSSPAVAGRYGARSEGGQKFLPPNPLPFCPPERKSFSKFSVRIFAKKSSDFVQRSEPNCMLRVCCLSARGGSGQIV